MTGVNQERSRCNATLTEDLAADVLGASVSDYQTRRPRAYVCTVCDDVLISKGRKIESARVYECGYCGALNSYDQISAARLTDLLQDAGWIEDPGAPSLLDCGPGSVPVIDAPTLLTLDDHDPRNHTPSRSLRVGQVEP